MRKQSLWEWVCDEWATMPGEEKLLWCLGIFAASSVGALAAVLVNMQ